MAIMIIDGRLDYFKTYAILYIKLKFRLCMFVGMYASVSRKDAPICTKLGMLICWDQEDILERLNSKKLSYVWVSVTVVPVAWKLSTTRKRRQGQSCSLRRGDYRNKGHKPSSSSPLQGIGNLPVYPSQFHKFYIFNPIFSWVYQHLFSLWLVFPNLLRQSMVFHSIDVVSPSVSITCYPFTCTIHV
jgi:hypothetical protein